MPQYDRESAVAYAHRWAYGRNPRYMDFSNIGGDCTNFVSQCLHAGGAPMNYTDTFGWYYTSGEDRAPAWSGVQYLYNFLLSNEREGPFAVLTTLEAMQIGDIIQLAFRPGVFTHSLLIVRQGARAEDVLIACHSQDSDNRQLSTYWMAETRYLHIELHV